MLALYLSVIEDNEHRCIFEDVYRSYRKQMFFLARSIVGNDSDAEDVVHDVFLSIAKKHMSKISKFKSKSDIRNYLLKATKNTSLNYIRQKTRNRISWDEVNENELIGVSDLSEETFIDNICNRMEYDKVVEAVLSLDEIYRDVLYYHFVMELSTSEVASLLERKVNTVKQQLIRGRKLLLMTLSKGADQNDKG